MKIAWIGTGVMGKAMLLHLKQAGHHVVAYNRTYEKAMELKGFGVEVVSELTDCVKNVDVVFSMVGYPQDVKDIYTRQGGILEQIKKHTILIDMTTSSPQLAATLYEKAKKYDAYMLDAPVSGGDIGAKHATLSIMCGGDKEIFERCLPLLSCLGKSIHYMGKAGNGQHCKACNQIAVAGAVAAMSESIVYAKQTGIDPQMMLEAIQGGAAGSWQLSNMAPRVLQNDFDPGFYIKHFIKDMHIIQDEMLQKNMQLPMLNRVCQLYEELAETGEENKGTQALVHIYQKDV